VQHPYAVTREDGGIVSEADEYGHAVTALRIHASEGHALPLFIVNGTERVASSHRLDPIMGNAEVRHARFSRDHRREVRQR
jgi:hypothetical protein